MTSVGKYTLLQELKDREAPTYAARCEGQDGASELVAIERYATDIAADAEDEASLEHAARSVGVLTELYHPNLASVRDVVVSAGEVLVVSAFVDGDSYGKLMPSGREKGFDTFPFGLKLAIVSDIVEGLAALHEFARAHDATIVHGGVTPRNVIVCADGRSRLVRVCNLFPEQVSPASPTLGYIAPELLDPTHSPEPSVDVFGAGVMLWEVLAGKRLAVQTNAPLLLLKEFDKGPPKGIPSEDLSWAKGLISVVERALSASDKRYKDAEHMARAIREVFAAAGEAGQVKTRATVKEVADFVEQASGERIRERRAELGFSAPLPLTASRATIAPMRSRPSIPDIASMPLPLPPPQARIYMPSMVDDEEFSSRSRIPSGMSGMDREDFPSMDQDENLAAVAPIMSPNDTLIIDAASRESLWVGGDPTDEREAVKAGGTELDGMDDDDRDLPAGADRPPPIDSAVPSGAPGPQDEEDEKDTRHFSSFPPALPASPEAVALEERAPEPVFEKRRERRPVLWGAVALAVLAALGFGYGLGRGQKPVAGQPAAHAGHAGSPVNDVPVAVVQPKTEITHAQPAVTAAASEPAVAPDPVASAAAAADTAKPATTEIELVPMAPEGARAAARRTRTAHGPRTSEASPATPPASPATPASPASPSSPASPGGESSAQPAGQDGRQKFNPQGI